MNIKAHIEKNYILIEVGKEVTLNDLKEYQYRSIDFMKYSNLIYDMTLFEFDSINTDDIENYVLDMQYINDESIAKKVGIVVNSDEGAVISRLYKNKAKHKLDFNFEIFSDKNTAIDWLTSKSDQQ